MRIAAIDALHFFGDIPNYPGDVCPVAVIDSPGGSPAFDDIHIALAARAEAIPALRELPRKVPLNLDYPHWVRDNQSVARLIREHPATEWTAVLSAITEIAHTPVDGAKDGWQLVVFRNVTGAPGISGTATVVLHQANHAITAGGGSSQILRALFGDDSALARIPGHGNPSEKVGVRAALQGLRRLPKDIRKAASGTAAGKRLAAMSKTPQPRASEALNSLGTGRSFIDIWPVETTQLKTLGTVTETALVAVSIALANYLAEQGEPAEGLTAVLPVAPKSFLKASMPVPAANTAGARAIVSLYTDIEDLRERADRIRSDLRDQILVCESDEVVEVRQAFEATPPFILAATARISAKRPPAKPSASVNVNSYHRGAADLELLGDPVRYIGAAATISPRLALTTQFNGLGGLTAVSVAADSSVPNPARFAELLRAAIAEVSSQ